MKVCIYRGGGGGRHRARDDPRPAYVNRASFSSSSCMLFSEQPTDSIREAAPRAAWCETPYPRALRKELMSSAACQKSRPPCMSSSRNEERSLEVNFSIESPASE